VAPGKSWHQLRQNVTVGYVILPRILACACYIWIERQSIRWCTQCCVKSWHLCAVPELARVHVGDNTVGFTLTCIQVACIGCHSMRPNHFGRRAKGGQLFLLASITTMIASTTTITTHHHRQNQSSTGNICICHKKTFCINCTQDSLCFVTKLNFKHVYRVATCGFLRRENELMTELMNRKQSTS
jgi:hypothetical protein